MDKKDKKPKRSREEWEDIIFHKGSYVALAISLILAIPVAVFFIIMLFQIYGSRAFLILFLIGLLVSYIAFSLKMLI